MYPRQLLPPLYIINGLRFTPPHQILCFYYDSFFKIFFSFVFEKSLNW